MKSKFTIECNNAGASELKLEEKSWREQLIKENKLDLDRFEVKISNLLQENGVSKVEAQETVQIIKGIQGQHKEDSAQRASLTIDMAQGALISAGVSLEDSKLIVGKIMTAVNKTDDTKPVQRQTQKMKI